jgi:CP family cyanate transporter-like MFS transporter
MLASAARVRGSGGLVMIAAVVLLAINLRPAVNALGVVMYEVQQSTHLSGTVSGLLLALPTLCFAVVGFAAPPIAARIGSHRAVLVALAAITGGQVLRAAAHGTWALFLGSIIALGGIAIGNVLLPGLIRLHFPSAIGPMTAVYTTVLMAGQALGAGITVPIEHGLGGSWRLGVGMWAVPAAVALMPWVAAVAQHGRGRRDHHRHRGSHGGARPAETGASADAPSAPPARPADSAHAVSTPRPRGPQHIPITSLARSGHAWALAVFFGAQSLQAYVMFGWAPTVLTDAGMTESGAAGILALLTAVGIPISALVPTLLSAIRRGWLLVVEFTVALALGYAGLIVMPTVVPWLLALLIGFGLGAFPMGLTLFALRARGAAGTTALSGFGQSVGYLIASIWPVGFGFLHDLSGGNTVPLIGMICTIAVLLLGGLIAVRRWVIEDELPADTSRAANGA